MQFLQSVSIMLYKLLHTMRKLAQTREREKGERKEEGGREGNG